MTERDKRERHEMSITKSNRLKEGETKRERETETDRKRKTKRQLGET